MTSIYKFNPNITIYDTGIYNPPLIDLQGSQKIYYTPNKYFEIKYKDIFNEYIVHAYSDMWPMYYKTVLAP